MATCHGRNPTAIGSYPSEVSIIGKGKFNQKGERVPLDRFFKASKRIRFAVEGDDGRYSTSWAMWEHRDTIYIASRSLGSKIKVSLHPHGGYRLAFTKEFHPVVRDRSQAFAARDFAVWPRPELDGNIALPVAVLCFPGDYLRSGPPPSAPKTPYLVFQVPQAGWAAHLGFFLSKAPAGELEAFLLTFGQPIFRWEFEDGSSISVASWIKEFDPGVLPNGKVQASIVPLTETGEIGSADIGVGLTGMIWNKPGPGVPLYLIEVGGLKLSRNET